MLCYGNIIIQMLCYGNIIIQMLCYGNIKEKNRKRKAIVNMYNIQQLYLKKIKGFRPFKIHLNRKTVSFKFYFRLNK